MYGGVPGGERGHLLVAVGQQLQLVEAVAVLLGQDGVQAGHRHLLARRVRREVVRCTARPSPTGFTNGRIPRNATEKRYSWYTYARSIISSHSSNLSSFVQDILYAVRFGRIVYITKTNVNSLCTLPEKIPKLKRYCYNSFAKSSSTNLLDK